ncbi:alpha/beta hydrolase [Lacibacter sp. H375]|uniref:alpha/beta fold hydrolase n=1 Tax=Lacibacter sp. H375 TaxID=3133424 RepID=UPI0030C2F296
MAENNPPDNKDMKIVIGLISVSLLWTSCNTRTDKIEFGSNNGNVININGKNIYYEEYGQGTPLLLLSGGGINRSIRDFAKCIPILSKHYRVIAPDTPGQGRSDQTDSLSYDLLTDFMSQLIDSLKIDSGFVLGWSDGAIVSLLLANRRADKIKKVIAVGANNGVKGFVIPDEFPLDSVKPPSLEYWAKQNKEDIEWYNTLTPKKDWKKAVNNMNRMVYEKEYFPTNVYNGINIPVMIVLGDRDMISIEHGLEMYGLIKNSQYCVLPNTTHEVFAERPDIINQVAIDFFK